MMAFDADTTLIDAGRSFFKKASDSTMTADRQRPVIAAPPGRALPCPRRQPAFTSVAPPPPFSGGAHPPPPRG